MSQLPPKLPASSSPTSAQSLTSSLLLSNENWRDRTLVTCLVCASFAFAAASLSILHNRGRARCFLPPFFCSSGLQKMRCLTRGWEGLLCVAGTSMTYVGYNPAVWIWCTTRHVTVWSETVFRAVRGYLQFLVLSR